jgi:putative ABC transport system ATP-binding protein
MADTILKLSNLSKTFMLGNKKNAQKAQKELQKLQERYERGSSNKDKSKIKKEEQKLKLAQGLFVDERYEDSYHLITGKLLKPRPRDRGVVVHALKGINLEIKKGELVAIMGPSGSGKSTLLNMLGLLDDPTAGQIFIKNQNITAIKHRELPNIRSRELGFVFQSFNLITTLTAQENVMLPLRYAGVKLRERKVMAKQALEQVGLGDRINHTPNELSGGQQQRVAIARSIVNNPSIVFGDELTGELDSSMTGEIMNLIIKLNRSGQTFVIVTHNPDVARRCKRIIYMKDGKIEKEIHRQQALGKTA